MGRRQVLELRLQGIGQPAAQHFHHVQSGEVAAARNALEPGFEPAAKVGHETRVAGVGPASLLARQGRDETQPMAQRRGVAAERQGADAQRRQALEHRRRHRLGRRVVPRA